MGICSIPRLRRASYAWKGLHQALSHLRDDFFWTLGVDRQVRLFRDRWGGFSSVTLLDASTDNDEVPLRCRDFMIPGQAHWDLSKLSAHLAPVDVTAIMEIPISTDWADTLIWGDHDSGIYTVRSLRFFGWPYGRDALPVWSRLRDAGLSTGACPLCGYGLEDTLHALHDCPDSLLVLRQAGFARLVPVSGPASSVEASALCAGLDFAITCGWTSAIVESDAATLVNKIRLPSPDLSLLGGLLSSARSMVAASSGRLQVCCAPRSANTIAHMLASWACKNNDVISFSSVCPELISQLLLDDLSSSF
ncbi:hypothetical protein GQ457_16G018190 [Hibiscus cannabinus]